MCRRIGPSRALREELTDERYQLPRAEESRHIQVQRMAATISATQYAHRYGMSPDCNLGVLDQPQEMTNCKDGENDTRDAQSSFLRVHAAILVVTFRFVSKILSLAATELSDYRGVISHI